MKIMSRQTQAITTMAAQRRFEQFGNTKQFRELSCKEMLNNSREYGIALKGWFMIAVKNCNDCKFYLRCHNGIGVDNAYGGLECTEIWSDELQKFMEENGLGEEDSGIKED